MSYIETDDERTKKRKNKDDEIDGMEKDSSGSDFSDIKDGEEL